MISVLRESAYVISVLAAGRYFLFPEPYVAIIGVPLLQSLACVVTVRTESL